MAEARLVAAGADRWSLEGDLVFDQVARIFALGETSFAGSARAELDLSRIGRIDSAGLALLLEWAIAARAAGRSIRYSNPPPALTTLAGIGEVSDLLGSSGG